MPDFTSALYLGLRHSTTTLRPWTRITGGHPAAFAEPRGAKRVAERLAELLGCESSVLGASTLHLFWDLFGIFGKQPADILFDSNLYAIGRWGVERAVGLGATSQTFRHHDPESLREHLERRAEADSQQIAVTDGFCPDCGKPAPLRRYIEILRAYDGTLVVDDTQAIGIFGQCPRIDAPFGKGGGGMLRWSGTRGEDVIVLGSLAKAFGAPIAVLAGSEAILRKFKRESETRVHCSPPSIASIRAAEHALAVNQRQGEGLRLRLAGLLARFRKGARSAGFAPIGGLFPVQSLHLGSQSDAVRVHEQLQRRGIRTVLRKAEGDQSFRISFLINARHTDGEIDQAVAGLKAVSVRSL